MSTLGWWKDEELKPSETQLPAPETQLPVSSLNTNNSKWHCDDNTKAYHEEYDMSISTVRHEMLNILHHPQQKTSKNTLFKGVFKFQPNHGVSTAIAASTGSHRGCEGLWQWNVAAAGTATTAGATCCDAWRKRWVKGMTGFSGSKLWFWTTLSCRFLMIIAPGSYRFSHLGWNLMNYTSDTSFATILEYYFGMIFLMAIWRFFWYDFFNKYIFPWSERPQKDELHLAWQKSQGLLQWRNRTAVSLVA